MARIDKIRRIDFDEEYARMLSEVCTALLNTGADRKEVRTAVYQADGYFKSYFPETKPVLIGDRIKVQVDAHPANKNPVPLILELERNGVLNAMEPIGRMLRDIDYTHDESKRIVQMFQALVRFHLKGDDDAVYSVHHSIMGE